MDDQEQTLSLLKKGLVWGCVSTRDVSTHGCALTHLGKMRYSLCCTPDFMTRWFPCGITLEALAHAPIMRFNRSDGLNDLFFNDMFGDRVPPLCEFFVPSSESFFQFVLSGVACGILPELQYRNHLQSRALVDCLPGTCKEVNLFWHSWSLKTPLMESFSRSLVAHSAAYL